MAVPIIKVMYYCTMPNNSYYVIIITGVVIKNYRKLTLALNELVEETGFPRPSTPDHEELEQEV